MTCRLCLKTVRDKPVNVQRHMWQHVRKGDCAAIIWPGGKRSSVPAFPGKDVLLQLVIRFLRKDSYSRETAHFAVIQTQLRIFAHHSKEHSAYLKAQTKLMRAHARVLDRLEKQIDQDLSLIKYREQI